MPDVAGSRKTWTNLRFAQPGQYAQEHEAHLQPGDQFPFTYGVIKDELTGKTDGILKRCQETGTCPIRRDSGSSRMKPPTARISQTHCRMAGRCAHCCTRWICG
jgi:hypothetical protein